MSERPLLEEPTRLSSSVVWDLQRQFYSNMGPEAWSSAIVPAAVSSNPRVAFTYAQLVVAFVQDCARQGLLDPSEPLYIVELGAGHGRLGYLLTSALRRLKHVLPADCPTICVVGTDYAPINVGFMHEHPFLEDARAAGEHDTALLDLETLAPLQCSSGAVVGPGAKNPVVVVANYIFDSLRTDLHRVDGDVFKEIWVAAREPDADGRLEGIAIDRHEVESQGYADPLLQEALDAHAGMHTVFWYPRGAIDVFRWFDGWNDKPMLTLVGDKQYRAPEEMDGVRKTGLVTHGSFSVTVNTFALSVVAQRLGGFAMHEPGGESTFSVSALLTSATPTAFEGTRLAYASTIEDFGPRPAHRLAWAFSGDEDLSAAVRLDLIQASGCDPQIFYRHAAAMCQEIEGNPQQHLVDRLQSVTARTADNVYPMSPTFRILYRLAATMEFLGHEEVAAGWFRLSLAFEGEEPHTWYRIGACMHRRHPDEAIAAYERAAELRPDWDLPRERLADLRG